MTKIISNFRLFIYVVLLPLLVFTSSCSSMRELPKYGFSEGIYNAKLEKKGKREKVYVDVFPDSLEIYQLETVDGKKIVNTTQKTIVSIPEESKKIDNRTLHFTKHTLDLDILTFPVKYRFSSGGIPPQVGSSLSATLYLGYRGDDFVVRYKKTPLGNYKKSTNHFGHSFGVFFGFSSADIRSEYTNGHVKNRYSGFALTSGGAFLVGINNFTVGFAVGFDRLLDKNRSHWIYQNQPWLGLTIGMGLQ